MKTLRSVLALMVLIVISFINIATASAGISYPVTFLNLGYGEGSDRAAVSGSLAYTVGSSGFQVYDVSDPVAPTRLYTGYPRWNYDVVGYGRYAFTTAYDRVNVIDVEDPYAPVIIGTFIETNGRATRLAMASHYLFITGSSSSGSELKVVDISVPTTPEKVGSLMFTSGPPRGIAISGQYAFIAINSGMAVVDISDPRDPILVAEIPLASTITYDVAVQGTFAYVTSHGEWCDDYEGCFWMTGTLHVVDITNPLSPTERGSVLTLQAAEDLVVTGSYVYLVEQSIGYSIHDYNYLEVNVGDPDAPQIEGYFYSKNMYGVRPSTAQGLVVLGDYVFQPITRGALVFARQPDDPLPSCIP
jgi:hypothetical protein